MDPTVTFLAQFRRGLVLADKIDVYVAQWHAAPIGSLAAQVDLHEYLGMTWNQYCHWVSTGEIPTF